MCVSFCEHSSVLSLSSKGRMLDLKTGTVKKESQQSSARMSMGARRSFICRMRLLTVNNIVYDCIEMCSRMHSFMWCVGLFVFAGVARVQWNQCQ